MSDSDRLVERQRATVFARSNLYFLSVMLLIVGVGDVFISGSWFYLILITLALIAYVAYLWSLSYVSTTPATLALFCVIGLLVAAAVFRAGGVMTAAVTLFSALILGIGLVLTERLPILIITAVTIGVYLVLAMLELSGILLPPAPGPELATLSTGYKVFALALQVALLSLVGVVISSVAGAMQHRTRALERARSEANDHAQEAEQLALQLNEKVDALRTTEDRLRRTVDQLAVPALPLTEGAVMMPLLGHFDEERGARSTKTLLQQVYEHRARLVLIDLTAIDESSEILAAMLLRMSHGARLLGAEVVVAGLQPAIARLLISQTSDGLGLRTFQTLEQAIDYALAQRVAA